jgi:putative nucleotidyltransferase with HDIG domain
MRNKIPVNKLTIGMYVDGMDAQWFDTPFLVHKFLLKNRSQIDKLIETGISHVFIDTEKGRDISGEATERELDKIKFIKKEDLITDEVVKDIDESGFIRKDEKSSVDRITGQPAGLPYTPEEVNAYYNLINNYTQIDRDTLVAGATIDFSLYLKKALKIDLLAQYDGKNIELTPRLLGATGDFMITRDDNLRYKGYLKELIQDKGRGMDKAAVTVKNRIIKENSKLLMQDLFEDPRSGEKIKECKGAVEDIVASIQDNRQLLSEMLTINKYDHYTYTHSVNVSVLSLGMAIELGINKDEELQMLGMGGMLHDIGKSKIPPSILNKPTRLTDEEYTVMKQHVLLGRKLLARQIDIPPDAIFPLMQHHEKLNGKGYPLGLKDSEIGITGRIVAIADTYDALTTARPYKKAFVPFEALSILRDQISDYDAGIFLKLVKMLGSLM